MTLKEDNGSLFKEWLCEKKMMASRTEKWFFILLSTPMAFICFVSSIKVILEDIPYLSPNCNSLQCASGSIAQFIVWTCVLLLCMAIILTMAYNCCLSSDISKYGPPGSPQSLFEDTSVMFRSEKECESCMHRHV